MSNFSCSFLVKRCKRWTVKWWYDNFKSFIPITFSNMPKKNKVHRKLLNNTVAFNSNIEGYGKPTINTDNPNIHPFFPFNLN